MLGGVTTLIVICLVVFPTSNFLVLSEGEAVMRPVDPNIEEGETLVLNCTITKPYDKFNASMIYVRSKNISYTAPRHIFPLDESTAQFRLEKVTVNDTGLFYCVVDSKRLQEARQYVHVFRRPLKPQVINCTLKQMSIFECYWMPSLSYQKYHVNIGKPLKQVLQVFYPNNESNANCTSLQYNCSIPLIKDQRDLLEMIKKQICVKVLLKIDIWPFIEAHSDIACWNLTDTIYPEAPTFLEMIESDEGCLLKWNQPFNELYKRTPLKFYLTIVPSYDKSERFFLEANETSHTFAPCQPYTNYLACISSMSVVGGFPSEITCFTFKTLPTVPCQSVDTSPYLVFNDASKKKTLLYWKPLHEKNFCGSGFHYVLLKKLLYNHLESYDISSTITGKDGTEWITLKAINASFTQQGTYDLCPSGDCTFAVAPKNDQGYQMDNVTSFQLPNDEKLTDATSITIDNLVCEVHEGSVILSWNTSDRRNLSSKMNATIVVYTCKDLSHPSICRNELHWKVAKSNVGHYNLSMGSYRMATELSYGIAIFLDGFSSEISWCNKIYNLYGTVEKPSDIYVGSADLANQMDIIQVHWSFRQDKCSNCSYVLSFTIFYCQSEDQKTCESNITQISVPHNVRMVEINNLKKDACYLVWMASVSRASMSNSTAVIVRKPSMKITYIVLLCFLVVALTVIPMICIFKYYNKCNKCKEMISRWKWNFKIVTPKYPEYDEEKSGHELAHLKNANATHAGDGGSPEYIPHESLNKDPISFSPYSKIKPISMNSISSLESNHVEIIRNVILPANKIDAQEDLSSGCSLASQISQLPNLINDYPVVASNYVPITTIS